MLSRVREFGANHAAAFPSGTIAADLLAQIGATVDLLSMHSATKATGTGTTRQGSVNRAKTRDALRADLEAISRTARAIGVRIEGVEAKFKLPPTGRDQSLLDAARSFAVEAVPLKAEFELLVDCPQIRVDPLNPRSSAACLSRRERRSTRRWRPGWERCGSWTAWCGTSLRATRRV